MVALAGTELEFIAFDTSYEQAHDLRWRGLTPVNQYNVDYSILGTTRAEPLLRDLRNTMYAAGLDVEGAKGECNFGQHEVGFLYADALVTADNHSVYKTVAKEIAAQRGQAITFMAKYDQREGNSCHIHLSLRGPTARSSSGTTTGVGRSTTGSSPACSPTMHDLTLLYAPNVNSYKRFAAGSFAPTAVAWGLDNRTCALRVVGQARAPGSRTGCPVATSIPTSPSRPCWPPGCTASRTSSSSSPPGRQRLPLRQGARAAPRCTRPATRSTAPSLARAAFGDDVVDHYTNMARRRARRLRRGGDRLGAGRGFEEC